MLPARQASSLSVECSMKPAAWIALLVAAATVACTQRTPEQQTVEDAASALGGRSRVLDIKTLVIEGEGTNGNLGQDVRPEATTQTFRVSDYKRTIDFGAGRARTE